MNNKVTVGILGASSLVGTSLLPLLVQSGYRAIAYSRKTVPKLDNGVEWRPTSSLMDSPKITMWISAAPIWVLPDYFKAMEASGVRRVVAVSSTSRVTKDGSSNYKEQAVSDRLADAEVQMQEWAQSRNVEWVILSPTMIYGRGLDKNISEIARFIRRFGFFPLFGKADGLRQPVHAHDVASACLAALQAPNAANRAYNLSGGEMLPYRDMVVRIFAALGRKPRLLTVPLPIFRVALAVLRCLPRYRHWSVTMAERMGRDLVFDHSAAKQDLAFEPRAFVLSAEDLPACRF